MAARQDQKSIDAMRQVLLTRTREDVARLYATTGGGAYVVETLGKVFAGYKLSASDRALFETMQKISKEVESDTLSPLTTVLSKCAGWDLVTKFFRTTVWKNAKCLTDDTSMRAFLSLCMSKFPRAARMPTLEEKWPGHADITCDMVKALIRVLRCHYFITLYSDPQKCVSSLTTVASETEKKAQQVLRIHLLKEAEQMSIEGAHELSVLMDNNPSAGNNPECWGLLPPVPLLSYVPHKEAVAKLYPPQPSVETQQQQDVFDSDFEDVMDEKHGAAKVDEKKETPVATPTGEERKAEEPTPSAAEERKDEKPAPPPAEQTVVADPDEDDDVEEVKATQEEVKSPPPKKKGRLRHVVTESDEGEEEEQEHKTSEKLIEFSMSDDDAPAETPKKQSKSPKKPSKSPAPAASESNKELTKGVLLGAVCRLMNLQKANNAENAKRWEKELTRRERSANGSVFVATQKARACDAEECLNKLLHSNFLDTVCKALTKLGIDDSMFEKGTAERTAHSKILVYLDCLLQRIHDFLKKGGRKLKVQLNGRTIRAQKLVDALVASIKLQRILGDLKADHPEWRCYAMLVAVMSSLVPAMSGADLADATLGIRIYEPTNLVISGTGQDRKTAVSETAFPQSVRETYMGIIGNPPADATNTHELLDSVAIAALALLRAVGLPAIKDHPTTMSELFPKVPASSETAKPSPTAASLTAKPKLVSPPQSAATSASSSTSSSTSSVSPAVASSTSTAAPSAAPSAVSTASKPVTSPFGSFGRSAQTPSLSNISPSQNQKKLTKRKLEGDASDPTDQKKQRVAQAAATDAPHIPMQTLPQVAAPPPSMAVSSTSISSASMSTVASLLAPPTTTPPLTASTPPPTPTNPATMRTPPFTPGTASAQLSEFGQFMIAREKIPKLLEQMEGYTTSYAEALKEPLHPAFMTATTYRSDLFKLDKMVMPTNDHLRQWTMSNMRTWVQRTGPCDNNEMLFLFDAHNNYTALWSESSRLYKTIADAMKVELPKIQGECLARKPLVASSSSSSASQDMWTEDDALNI